MASSKTGINQPIYTVFSSNEMNFHNIGEIEFLLLSTVMAETQIFHLPDRCHILPQPKSGWWMLGPAWRLRELAAQTTGSWQQDSLSLPPCVVPFQTSPAGRLDKAETCPHDSIVPCCCLDVHSNSSEGKML